MRSLQRVVITGVGVVSPNGIGRAAFTEALRQGHSGIGPIRAFDPSPFPARIAAEVPALAAGTPAAGKEAQHLPRVARLALTAGAEAFADAGVDCAALTLEERRAIGVIIGSGGGNMAFAEEQYRLWFAGQPLKNSVYAIPSSTTGAIASELSIAFGLRGSSHVLSTGCTSSTDAIGYALQQVRWGAVPLVLTGGCDATITPGMIAGCCLMKVLPTHWNDAPERASRPFSKDREGFVLGEGAWMLVVESLARAQARGARIYAELLGYGATCEAFHRVRMQDDGEESARAMRLALDDAGLPPEAVDYLNLHGTSTPLNDRVETRAVRRCFRRHADRLSASALKSMIGHPQGASGAASVAATVLSLQAAFLHPTLNLDAPDPECDLNYLPHRAVERTVGTALCNSLSFGSKNAALVLRRWDGAAA